ncbi:MAG: flagellar hook-basal body complex protein FliE [Acidocella sp. 20-57-95]|nr:MAG: flagellar hook-basal body complex protein FliE [Acidocella sp. 20-57-95]OYV57932.1 MAG: flagellar hook-basal body complex protein FliE [Acidocella sp. 21-58-7]HQT63567.1 flagellar hook-basal body complex protein FliE [Acidocella sp.]
MTSDALPSIFSVTPSIGVSSGIGSSSGHSVHSGFFEIIDNALKSVSDSQQASATAESSFVAGMPGASLSNALVASDRAEVAWNATVAIRNEVVSAYQSIMNMPL